MITDELQKIQARLDACPIPVDAVADWDHSEHWEIQDPCAPSSTTEYWWLVLSELISAAGTIVPSNTPDGQRLGAVFDYACAYRRDVGYLLRLLR